MSDPFVWIAMLLMAVIAGYVGYRLRQAKITKDTQTAGARAHDLIKHAEEKQNEVLQKAKEKAIKILEEARLEEKRTLDELKTQQIMLLEREQAFSTKLLEIDKTKTAAETEKTKAEEIRAQLEKIKADEQKLLEEISGFTKDQALARVMELVEQDNEDAILNRIRKIDEVASDEIEVRANNIIALAIQKQAASQVAETTTTYVELPTDEMKGRIIGREGRNIKAIELLTGCELIIDETPNLVTISGFSPIRRQVAKRALAKLIADGRIHPGRIEESIEEAKRELAVDIRKAGEDALYQMGISMAGIDPKLVQILGRLKFRTSYGQSALQHSIEVASLASTIAEELGANVKVCKTGGLFHDIGKAVDHDMQGSHPELGYQIMKKFGFAEEICYQCIGHHEDKPKTLEGVIVKSADAISGARPGARKDTLEMYVKRLEDLEGAATSFEGVEKVYAIQAGREIRVFVNPRSIDDLTAVKLARDIANKIEAELKHPGEIRVTVIRETRVVEYAR